MLKKKKNSMNSIPIRLICIKNKDIKEKFLKKNPYYNKFISDNIITDETLIVLTDIKRPLVDDSGILYINTKKFNLIFPKILTFLKDVSITKNIEFAANKLIKSL